MVMLCSEGSLVNHGLQRIRAVTLWCNCWSCENCVGRRKKRLVRQVTNGVPNKFLTLTTSFVEGSDPVQEAHRQGVTLGKLIRRIKKRLGDQCFAYFVVREATKRGWPHMHLALRSPYIPQKWLSEQWEILTGSPGVDIRAVYQVGNVASYLAKYIGKSPHRFGTTKRYWYSRNWFDVMPEREPPDINWNSRWWIVPRAVVELAQEYYLRRWDVDMHGALGFFEARAPP